MRRVEQEDWENPKHEDWLLAIDREVAAAKLPVILVAHSLACLAVAHWGQKSNREPILNSNPKNKVAAALLVAPPDPKVEIFPPSAQDFGSLPQGPLDFRSHLIYSTDDPYATPAFSLHCAHLWQCEPKSVGALGHINSQSALGLWPQGMTLLESLMS
jgi:predicted alpha/beta hydrolase family esterase